MPLINIPAALNYNNYIGNIKVAKTVLGTNYDSSLYIGEATSYSSSAAPLIESGIVNTGSSITSIKSLIAFPINISTPTTLESLYGTDVIINNVTLNITGVKSSSLTPENLDINFYYVDVPSSVAVEASTEGNILLPTTSLLYSKKNSFKLGSLKTPIIEDFSVVLDKAFYYYIKNKEYFYLLVETSDQNYNNPSLGLQIGQEHRLVSTEASCSANIVINYTIGVPSYTSCGYTLGSSTLNIPQEGGNSTVEIYPSPYGHCLGGEWSILNSNDYPWLSFNSTSGFGSDVSTLVITATNNSTELPRTAFIQINDQILSISQAGLLPGECSFYLSSTTLSGYKVPLSAGSITVPILTTPSGCSTGTWSVSSDAPWISFDKTSGTAEDTSFTIYYESSTQRDVAGRRANIYFEGTSFVLMQSFEAVPCTTFSPSFRSVSVPAPAITLVLEVTSDAGLCSGTGWTLSSLSSWITVGDYFSDRSGRKFVNIHVSENTGIRGRAGTLSLTPSNGGLIIVSQVGLSAIPPPDPPLNVEPTLLSNNTSVKITVDTGSQTDITGFYYRVISNGIEDNWKTISYLNPFTITGLKTGFSYYFDVCLIKDGAISAPTRSIQPIQPISPVPIGSGSGIVGPKNVKAAYDSITDSIVLSWENNDQTTLTGYKISYYQSNQGIAYPLYTSTFSGTTYTITDLSGFNKEQYYIFNIALVKNSEISVYSPSNPVYIPTSTLTGQEIKVAPKLFYYPYPNINSADYRPITHFVNRKTTGIASDPANYYTLYRDDTAEAIYASDPVRSGFVNHYLSLTNSFNDKVSQTTTWNYENRVGFLYFELPTDSYIENPYFYFYFSPEPMGIPFDSDGVSLDIRSVPSNFIEEVGNQLRINKRAYVVSAYSSQLTDKSYKIKDIKTSNPVVLKVPLKVNNNAIYTTASGKKILPVRLSISLPKDFTLPTGYNAISFAKNINAPSANNSGIGFAFKKSSLDRPSDFRIKPISNDIEIYWKASISPFVNKYEIIATESISKSSYSIFVPSSESHDVSPFFLSTLLSSNGKSVVPSTEYSIKMRALTSSDSDRSDFTYSLSALSSAPVASSILPFPPLDIEAFYGPEKVFVSWNAPTSDMEVPIYKFRIYTSQAFGSNTSVLPTVDCYIDQNKIKYEKFGLELNNSNAGIVNGSWYTFAVSSVSAAGESYVQTSSSVLPNEIKRLQDKGTEGYKAFYEYPVELNDPATMGNALYPEYVDGHSSIFGDLVDRYDYILASNDIGSTVTFTDLNNVCRIKVWQYTGEDEIFIVNFPEGTYKYPQEVVQFIQSAIDTNIHNGEKLPLTVGVADGTRIYVQHTLTTNDPEQATLELIDRSDSANDLLFGSGPIIASPNVITRVDRSVPTVDYDKTAKRALVDSRPYKKVSKRFDIVPASKTATSTAKYPLSFNLNADKIIHAGGHTIPLINQYDTIRIGSVVIEWYVGEVKEILFDNGDGRLLSLPKVDACGNKVPSQALGVVDYASGIISCNLPSITSGYVNISYLVDEKVSNSQEYIWMPTPHYALELDMYEPIFFTYPHFSYIIQNQAKLKPGYTVLEYLKITAHLASDFSSFGSQLDIDIQ